MFVYFLSTDYLPVVSTNASQLIKLCMRNLLHIYYCMDMYLSICICPTLHVHLTEYKSSLKNHILKLAYCPCVVYTFRLSCHSVVLCFSSPENVRTNRKPERATLLPLVKTSNRNETNTVKHAYSKM